MRTLLLALSLCCALGCQSPTLPDPNDPKLGAVEPEVLRRSLKGASNAFLERVARREIDDRQFQDLMAQTARRILQGVTVENTDPSLAWEYGEVFRTARQWATAEVFLKVAVQNATESKDEDRRVNDLLRLAHVQAMQNRAAEAIATARLAYDTPDEGAAPILPATLLEIVPAGRGKGQDAELAKLLIDAIACHQRTKVDPQSEAGQAFLAAKSHHIRGAYRTALLLLQAAGDTKLTEEVLKQAQQWMGSSGRA